MTFEEIFEIYALNDGEILSYQLDYQTNSLTIKLKVRKSLGKNKFKSCVLELEFTRVIEVNYFEDFRTSGGYSDVTFINQGESFYLSLDPSGNSGLQHEEDNLIVKAKNLTIIDEQGIRYSISNT